MKNKTGLIIAAAFIGPGTVTTASMAGAEMGLHLFWALLFSVFTTILLQDMVLRLGLATGKGLSEAVVSLFEKKWLKYGLSGLIILSIGIGNAAYQSGNLTGAGLGLASILDGSAAMWASILGVLALVLLYSGSFKYIESVLIFLVALMSLVFAITFLVMEPDWLDLFQQAMSPRFSLESLSLILALIGTTIVPYNLFLHASLASQYNGLTDEKIKTARKDSALAIGLGGLITLVILSTSAMTFFAHGKSLDASNLASQLAPLLGDNAYLFFALGLFAAGLTSAITAPLAAGYAICALFNLPTDLKSLPFKAVITCVIVIGTLFAALGSKPLTMILIAQVTNALLLPIIVALLIWVVSKHPGLAHNRNSKAINALVMLCWLVITGLALYKLNQLIF